MIRPALRLFLLCLIGLMLSLAGTGKAQAQPAAPTAAAASTPAALPAVDPAALGHLIETLQDPITRDRFLSDLKALQAAQQNAQPAAAAPALPYALGAELLQAMTDAFGRFRAGFEELASSLGDPARLWTWARLQVEDPARRALLVTFLWQLALILGVGIIADVIARHYLRGGQRHLRPVVKPRSLGRIGLLLAHSALELLPILAFAVAAYAVVAVVQPGAAVRLALLAIVSAVVIARTAFVICRFLLSPFAPTLRLFPLGDETAAYFYIWAKRLISLAVYGYFVLQVAVLLGLPDSAYELALKMLGLVWALLVVALILQSRDSVAKMILHGAQDREDRLRNLTRLRRQFAHSWHVLALLYLLAVYVTWATDVPGGFAYLGRGTGLTVLILVLAWLALALLRAGFQRFLVINQDLLGRYPMLEQRTNRYLPLLRRALAALIRIFALLAILGAWQVDIGSILAGAVAREIIGRSATILLMLGAALAIWEIVDAAISFYLERRDDDGKPILTSSRARTLLPLVRNALLIVISLLAGLTILSELGVNIAPLLAGAGVVGLAIGFGAQTLVKDVITGAFILFEDTVNVGDVIAVNGISGTVEGMSVRTLKIRAGDGTLHSIPFGTVATVSNQSRDFGYYAIDVAVDYGESTDKVIAALREVFADLVRDPVYRSDILGGLEIQGVDRFTDNAVHIVAGIRTRALRQAPVGREFNRRMKIKFDELGIRFSPPPRLAYAMAPGGLTAPAEALPGPATLAEVSPAPKPSS